MAIRITEILVNVLDGHIIGQPDSAGQHLNGLKFLLGFPLTIDLLERIREKFSQ